MANYATQCNCGMLTDKAPCRRCLEAERDQLKERIQFLETIAESDLERMKDLGSACGIEMDSACTSDAIADLGNCMERMRKRVKELGAERDGPKENEGMKAAVSDLEAKIKRLGERMNAIHAALDKAGAFQKDGTHGRAVDRINLLGRQRNELEAIVDKLPKCWTLRDGVLVREQVVLWGYFVWNIGGAKWLVRSIAKDSLEVDNGNGSVFWRNASDYYASPLAAEKAKEVV